MVDSGEMVLALRPVIAELTRLNVRYYIGGSVASSFHGLGRSTIDVDVATELNDASAAQLIEALSGEYYVSEAAVRDAIRRQSCFNLVHLATSLKIDIFVSQKRPFDLQVFARADLNLVKQTESLLARIASAEDIILLKLEWYRLGNFTSERQWNDLSNVAKLYGDRLDRNYLRHWAGEIGIADLLDKLFAEIEPK